MFYVQVDAYFIDIQSGINLEPRSRFTCSVPPLAMTPSLGRPLPISGQNIQLPLPLVVSTSIYPRPQLNSSFPLVQCFSSHCLNSLRYLGGVIEEKGLGAKLLFELRHESAQSTYTPLNWDTIHLVPSQLHHDLYIRLLLAMSRMWEVDPETRTKVRPSRELSTSASAQQKTTNTVQWRHSSFKSPKRTATTDAATVARLHPNGFVEPPLLRPAASYHNPS